MKIDFFNTYVAPDAEQRVLEVLHTTRLSEGDVTRMFEDRFSHVFDLPNVIALNSGTSALHLALELAGVGHGDEVIITPQTFIATGLAVLYCKAVPVFADIKYDDGNIDVNSVKDRINKRTKAIISVDWGGYPCDMRSLREVADAHGIALISDSAHSLGAVYNGAPAAALADIACFSFQAIKHLTTGDGGAISVRDTKRYDLGMKKRWFGIDRKNSQVSELGERIYDLDVVGYKYHMNNYAAALGLANLNGFHARLEKRQALARFYRENLSGLKELQLFKYEENRMSSYWLFGFHVNERLNVVRRLKEAGIPSSVVHQRIDKYSLFGGIDTELRNVTRFDDTQLHIPIHDAISMEQGQYIVEAVRDAVKH